MRILGVYLSNRISVLNALASGSVAIYFVWNQHETASSAGFALACLFEFYARVFWTVEHLSGMNPEMTALER